MITYVISSNVSPYCKIGKTNNLQQRLSQIKEQIIALVNESNSNRNSFKVIQGFGKDQSFEELKSIYSQKQTL